MKSVANAPSDRPKDRFLIGRRLTSRDWFVAVLVLGALGSLWIRTGFPAHIIAGTPYDDALFVRLARFMLLGQWLGPFGNTTLVKGIGYPVFAALSFGFGIPLKTAETLFYLAMSAMTATWVVRWSRSYLLGSLLFLGLAFNPVLWGDEPSRVIREGLYVSLSLAALSMTVALVIPRPRSARRDVALALATGVIWAWFWLTREEGLWLIPSLFVALGFGAFAVWRMPVEPRRQMAPRVMIRIGVAGATGLLIIASVAFANLISYGRFETVEVKSAPFERAYGALYRVKPARFERLVVFPADVRQKVYAVSPAARELRPSLEGENGRVWRRASCGSAPIETCPEILAGWFQWALRDAAAAAGHYRSAATAAAFYNRLADEVNQACETGRLECLSSRSTLAPPFRMEYLTGALKRLPLLVQVYWQNGLHVPRPNYSVVFLGEPKTDPEQVMRIADFVGSAQPTAGQAGWSRLATQSRDHAIWIIASSFATIYAPLLVVMMVLSPLGLFILLRRSRGLGDQALALLVICCWIAVFMRAGLLVYLDVTSIPSVNILYASPASALLVVAAVVGTLAGMLRLREERASR